MTHPHEREDGGPAFACAWCDEPAHIKQGRIWLCQKHYRFSSMRSTAKRDGKEVPSRNSLEAMVPAPFVCGVCNREMNWLRDQGASTQATLQHDRSGEMRFLCHACNTRHAQHPGDSYYDLPEGSKRCAKCERILPHASFAKDRSRPLGLKSSCRECSGKAHAVWRRNNREYYNAKQRENRANRAARSTVKEGEDATV